MKNKLIVSHVEIQQIKITCHFTVCGEWSKFFRLDTDFYAEYNYDLSELPKSVAIIPLIGNILPLAWLCNAEIYVDEIDEDYFESISETKMAYEQMYKQFSFGGLIKANRLIKNTVNTHIHKSLLLFSGGVDAVYSMVDTIDNSPMLTTVCGADIPLHKIDGWNITKANTIHIAQQLNLETAFIKTTFREIFNHDALNMLAFKVYNNKSGNYWHEFQHGIGFTALTAPLAYIHNIRTVYIANTFTCKDGYRAYCASDPAIDNSVRFFNCKIIHHGFENDRSDKVRKACRFITHNSLDIQFRVCWVTQTGKNCNHCEKCTRTILEIAGEGYNPNDFGFVFTPEHCKNLVDAIEIGRIKITSYWHPAIRRILQRMPDTENVLFKYLFKKIVEQ